MTEVTAKITAGVIGWPVEHSRSPFIHGYWLDKYQIDGMYDRFPVKPEALGDFVATAKDKGMAGFNVTIPHKETVLEFIDEVDEHALRLGAVNTVYFKDGKYHGMNTDGEGFLANLARTIPDWSDSVEQITLLGAGGAARGITAALCRMGKPNITLVNRTRARAEKMAVDFNGQLRVHDWDDLPDLLPHCDLLINTTALGMTGQPVLKLPLERLKPQAIVADIVYAPLWTDLLKRSQAYDHRVVEGLGMLIHQAVPGFKAWFGVEPEVTDELYVHLLSQQPAMAL